MLFRYAPTKNEIREALLDEKKTVITEYQSTRINISPVFSERKIHRLQTSTAGLRKKRLRKKIVEFIIKYEIRLHCVLSFTISGITLGALYKFYDKKQFEDLEQSINQITLNYTSLGCPGNDYWYHPEQSVICIVNQRNFLRIPLLVQGDYCGLGCFSNFADTLIKNLSPPICVSIMNFLCDAFKSIVIKNNERDWAIVMGTLIGAIIPIVLLLCIQSVMHCTSRINREDQIETQLLITQYGLKQPENSLSLDYLDYALPNLEKVQLQAAIYKTCFPIFKKMFGEQKHENILQTLLEYADALPDLVIKKNAANRAVFLCGQHSSNKKKSLKNKCYLPTFFKKLEQNEFTYHSMKNGSKLYVHADAEKITNKIFKFAGL